MTSTKTFTDRDCKVTFSADDIQAWVQDKISVTIEFNRPLDGFTWDLTYNNRWQTTEHDAALSFLLENCPEKKEV
jgi:hypothetical protein